MENKNIMSAENSQSTSNLPQPLFQWEAPVLHTEDWLKTLGGNITDFTEDIQYHT